MKTKYSDDLFAETTMTFGEHLDELRVSLFKAAIGLAIGTVIGLLIGDWFVEAIEAPLRTALTNYYKTGAETTYETWGAQRERDHLPLPYTVDEIHELVADHNLLFDIQYIDPQQVLAESARINPRLLSPPQGKQNSAGGKADSAAQVATEPPPAENKAEPASGDEASAGATTVTKRLTPIFVFHTTDDDPRIRPKAMSMTEPFSIWLKASLVVGIILSSPWVFYQIWSFVAAGLYPHEKRYVYTFLPFSLGLFLAGAALAYLFVFEPVLGFLLNFNRDLGIDSEPRINEWLSFVLILPLGFGVSFQLPLVMLFLNRLGIFSVGAYMQKWRIAVLVIFVLSAILTPADPYSILFMAVPLTLLYFGGVLLCRYLPSQHGTGRDLVET